MNGLMKKWIPILSLAVVPIAQAQDTVALKTASEATADTVRSAAEAKHREQQLQELKKEVDAIRDALAVERDLRNMREFVDQDSHPLWP
jgi:hypothetical protein